MFFKAFASVEGSTLPNSLTFTIENQASQVLANCDRSFLRQVVDDQHLPESLCAEVEFFGSIPRNLQNEVRAYFHAHAKTLYDTARQLLDEPDNVALRDEVERPLLPEEEVRKLIGVA
jgi:hypothetical protein